MSARKVGGCSNFSLMFVKEEFYKTFLASRTDLRFLAPSYENLFISLFMSSY